MSVVESTRPLTPADLLALPDAKCFELVDGKLVEKKGNVLSGYVEGIIATKIYQHLEVTKQGYVWLGTTGIQCFPDAEEKVRKPDAFFVRRERFKPEYFADGFLTIAPDLAVEVLSPNDLAYEIDEKVEEYLNAGVRLVWVIDPENRIVMIHRRDGSTAKLKDSDELDGEDVLPGFHCPIADLFPSK